LDLCGSEYRILAGACVDTIEPPVAIDLLVTSYSDVTWLGFSQFVVLQMTTCQCRLLLKKGVALVHERRKLRKTELLLAAGVAVQWFDHRRGV
jgi:hypothetical protein